MNKSLLALVVPLLLSSGIMADDGTIPEAVIKYLDAEKAAKETAIEKAAADLLNFKRALKASDDLDQRKELVKQTKEAEANLKAQTSSTSPRVILPNNPERDAIGFVKTVKVIRILGDQQFLAETTGYMAVNTGGRTPELMRIEMVEMHASLVIQGIDTKTLEVDEDYKVDRVCQVTGVQKIGGEKVPVGTVLDVDKWKAEWAKMSKAKGKPKTKGK